MSATAFAMTADTVSRSRDVVRPRFACRGAVIGRTFRATCWLARATFLRAPKLPPSLRANASRELDLVSWSSGLFAVMRAALCSLLSMTAP